MDGEGKFELMMFHIDNKFKRVLKANNVREYGENEDSANYCRSPLFMM